MSILTIEDYISAYNALDGEWREEIGPALCAMKRAIDSVKSLLAKYSSAAKTKDLCIDPYANTSIFFGDSSSDNHLKMAVQTCNRASRPTFRALVEESHMWTSVLKLSNSMWQVKITPDQYNCLQLGLLWWRGHLNELKDGIAQFHKHGAAFLAKYVERLINTELAPQADREANAFFEAFGMAPKAKKLKITFLVEEV